LADLDSFEDIYDEHVSMVFNLCLNYVQQREEAEEITQDVFLKVYQKFNGFNQRAQLKTWIYRISINACLDHLKAKKRKKRSIFFSQKEEDLPEVQDMDHPGVLLENQEALKELFKHIESLPEKQRSVLILKAIEGLSQKEIADILKTSEKAVESLFSRAKENLRQTRKDSEGKR